MSLLWSGVGLLANFYRHCAPLERRPSDVDIQYESKLERKRVVKSSFLRYTSFHTTVFGHKSKPIFALHRTL